MTAIPRALYSYVERRLHGRNYDEVARASQTLIDSRGDATSLKSPSMDRIGGRSSGISNSVQDGATRVIAAEERLSAAIRWSLVYARLDELFAGTPEGEVAQALYREKMTAAKIAEQRMVDRQTVRRLRDTYVTHAALLAAEYGLVRMSRFTGEAKNDGHDP